MRVFFAILLCIASSGVFCGPASAIPADPAINIEEKGKARVLTEYLVLFQKAFLNSHTEVVASDGSPYDKNALDKANEEHDRQAALCKANRSEFTTEAAYAGCLIAARRNAATAIGLKDFGLVEAITSTFNRVALDADAGRLTGDQASDVYEKLDAVYNQLLAQMTEFYDFQLEARLGADYKNRFIKSYGETGSTAPMSVGVPPLDDDAEGPAVITLSQARETCEESEKSTSKKLYVDCVLAAEKKFSDTVNLSDRGWYKAYEAALRGAVADVDSKRLTPAQFDTVAAWLGDAYTERINQQQSEYHALVARPIAEGYVVRFGAAYVAVAGNWYNDEIMPFDSSSMDQAVRDQREAGVKCHAEYKATNSEVSNLECYIAIYRKFAQAIKLRDSNLLELYISAMRGAASDTDAGRLTKWQKDAVYEALSRYFSSVYEGAADAYLSKHYRVVARPYLNKFDNDYIAAGGTAVEERDMPPWDRNAVPAAQNIYDQSITSCYEQRAELKTNVAYWDCRATAEKELAAATHRRDMVILEKLLAAINQAAADADAGKISKDELDGICSALSTAYRGINESAWRAWHVKQQMRGTAQ